MLLSGGICSAKCIARHISWLCECQRVYAILQAVLFHFIGIAINSGRHLVTGTGSYMTSSCSNSILAVCAAMLVCNMDFRMTVAYVFYHELKHHKVHDCTILNYIQS